MRLDCNTWLFLLLCLIWGSTWIGIKAGINAVPPLFFAGTRFTAAGIILLAFVAWRQPTQIARRHWTRLAWASLLMITFCYGPLFWAMRYVDSGTAAVLELALTPIALMTFAVAFREERITRRKLSAIALGVCGLLVLFGPTASIGWAGGGAGGSEQILGVLGIAAAAFTYGLGSIIARPLLRAYPASLVAGATTTIGGLTLLALSFGVEPKAAQALRGDWGAAAWAGWLFLVIFGSLIGYTVYMRLLRDIGASRAGAYAFVSPVVAVLLGVLVLRESVGIIDVVGMVILLGAAWLAMDMRGEREVPTRSDPVGEPALKRAA